MCDTKNSYANQREIVSDFVNVYGEKSIIIGNDCNVYGNDCEIYGDNCEVYGDNCEVYGNNCNVYGDNSEILGKNCKILENKITSLRRLRKNRTLKTSSNDLNIRELNFKELTDIKDDETSILEEKCVFCKTNKKIIGFNCSHISLCSGCCKYLLLREKEFSKCPFCFKKIFAIFMVTKKI
jgi:hypothetical protein